MKTMSLKLVVMMALCLHLTACGKSKSDGVVQATPPAAEKSPDTEQAQGEKPTEPSVQTDSQSHVEVKDGVSAEKDENVPSTAENPIHTKIQNLPGSGGSVASKPATPEKPRQPVSASSDLSRSVEKMRQDANKFSGAGDDGLRASLQQKEEDLSLREQYENLKAAQTIQNVILRIDRTLLKKVTNGYRVIEERTGDVALNMTLGSGQSKRTVMLGGLMRPDRTSSLRNVKEGMKAELKCMDLALADIKTCETALITMQLGAGNVKMILRRTPMTVQSDFGTKQCLSQECEDIYAMMIQTERGVQDVKSIARASLESFEVIGGKSGFRGMIRTRGNSRGGQIEGIYIGGDLMNEKLNPVMNQIADRAMNIIQIPDFTGYGINTNMHRSMSDIRIIGNDGVGSIRMRVSMSRQDNGSVDIFDLSFSRIAREVLN